MTGGLFLRGIHFSLRHRQLHNIFFIQFGDNIQTARQLRNAIFC